MALGNGSVGGGSGSLEGVDETLGACGAVSGERDLTITDHQGGRVSAQVDVKRGRAGRGGEDGDKAVLHFDFFVVFLEMELDSGYHDGSLADWREWISKLAWSGTGRRMMSNRGWDVGRY